MSMSEKRDGYIDCLWRGTILIEMKSRGKSLGIAKIRYAV